MEDGPVRRVRLIDATTGEVLAEGLGSTWH